MSKKKKSSGSAPKPPKFSPSAVMYGDQLVGQTYKDKKLGIVTKYSPTPEEQARKSMADAQINAILPTLGQTAPEIGQRFDQMRDDYIGQQTDIFNREYDKTLRDLREDIGSRFGTLKATPYFDRLQSLERDIRIPAYLDIQRAGSLYRTDLDNQEQARKLNELSALGQSLTGAQQTFLNNIQAPLSSSQLMNNFNQNQYQQQLAQYQQDQARRASTTNSFLNYLTMGLLK